eukprot:2649267-Alexandrium_andersonii.AAC.1
MGRPRSRQPRGWLGPGPRAESALQRVGARQGPDRLDRPGGDRALRPVAARGAQPRVGPSGHEPPGAPVRPELSVLRPDVGPQRRPPAGPPHRRPRRDRPRVRVPFRVRVQLAQAGNLGEGDSFLRNLQE